MLIVIRMGWGLGPRLKKVTIERGRNLNRWRSSVLTKVAWSYWWPVNDHEYREDMCRGRNKARYPEGIVWLFYKLSWNFAIPKLNPLSHTSHKMESWTHNIKTSIDLFLEKYWLKDACVKLSKHHTFVQPISSYRTLVRMSYNRFAAFSLRMFPLLMNRVQINPTPETKTTLLILAAVSDVFVI